MRILALLLITSCAFGQSPEDRTRQVLDQLLANKIGAVYAKFSPKMRSAISQETYTTQMAQIVALGPPQKIDAPRTQAVGDLTVVAIGVHWAPVSLDCKVVWNKAGEIDGQFWSPAEAAKEFQSAPYAHLDSFTSLNVTVGDDAWKLPGTLTMPKGDGPFPALVLVHGSGPNDRDESVGGAKVFRDLAEGLASRGVAVLRYEKRTRQYPQQCAADAKFTVNQETVEDAARAVALLRTQTKIDPARVFVLGHSLGGYLAPRILRRDPKIAGFVVMAGNVRPLEELIVDQTEYIASLKGNLIAEDQAKLAEIKKNPFAGMSLPAAYMADLKGYHPDAEAKKLDIPMLILQGERDYQVTMKDFDLWKSALQARRNVRFHTYPNSNHLFIAGEGKSRPEEYQQSGHVDEKVIGDIATWILQDQKSFPG
ncbi:MAG: alpha/beta fold hydrolase [Terracidiphilus sp.]|jgi:dienelactone hydrolase